MFLLIHISHHRRKSCLSGKQIHRRYFLIPKRLRKSNSYYGYGNQCLLCRDIYDNYELTPKKKQWKL